MIVAVTGGSGFIGGELVMRHIELGDEVRVLSRASKAESFLSEHEVKWFQLGADNQATIETFVNGADMLYNCAGETYDTELMQSANVEFTKQLIDVAAGKVSKWIQLSTVAVYGQNQTGSISEQSQCNPSGAYGKTKLEADKFVSLAGKSGAFEYVLIRPTIVYGERMSSVSLYRIFSHIQRGTFFFIGYGMIANYIHVQNVVEAMVFSGKSARASGQTYIVSGSCSIERFVSAICMALSVKEPWFRIPEVLFRRLLKIVNLLPMVNISSSIVDALTSSVSYDESKILNEIGVRNFLSIEQGINKMVKYWLKINNKR